MEQMMRIKYRDYVEKDSGRDKKSQMRVKETIKKNTQKEKGKFPLDWSKNISIYKSKYWLFFYLTLTDTSSF